MDVLLITPDQGESKKNFPWGVLSMGSYLTTFTNYTVRLLDASVMTETDFLKSVKYYCKEGVPLIGISAMSTDTYFLKTLVDYIKEINSDCKIIVGGIHAILNPEQTSLYKNIDFVAYTEGEYSISLLLEQIKSRKHQYEKVPGLIYKEGNSLKKTPRPDPINFYDINYDLLPEITQKILPEYIQILTGRGCSFKCTFCFTSVAKMKWKGRSIKEVISEIDKIIDKYNTKVIYFRDENFFHSRERILEFISLYKENKYSFRWRAGCRASYYNNRYMNFELLKELESINCETLKIGLESGSQKVLNFLKKGHEVESAKKLIFDLGRLNIQGTYSFMIGIPGETFEDYKKTLSLVKYVLEHEPSAAIIGPQYFRVSPGGELYEMVKKEYNLTEIDSFEEWAERYRHGKDLWGLEKDMEYPWIHPKNKFLVKYADFLVFLFQQNLNELKKPKWIVLWIFVLIAKIRFKYGWWRCLYDLRCFMYLVRFREKHPMLKKYFKKNVNEK